MASNAGRGTDRLQPWARPFVTVLLTAFVTCGVFGIEAWPLSGFRLFSAPRSSVTTGWRLVAITADDGQVTVNVSKLGAAYRGFGFVARSLDLLPASERISVCRTWLRAVESIGIDATGLRLMKVEQRLRPRDGDAPLAEPHHTEVATCSPGAGA
jgi:hypothetical protein